MMQQQSDISTLEAQKQAADAAVVAAERDLTNQTRAGRPIMVESGQPWSPELVMTLGLGFLFFALVVLVLMTWTMRQLRNYAAILRAFGLLMIITAAVFLVIVGYGERQLAPVLGLLGTIAGYLLGKGADDNRAAQPTRVAAEKGSDELSGG